MPGLLSQTGESKRYDFRENADKLNSFITDLSHCQRMCPHVIELVLYYPDTYGTFKGVNIFGGK